MNRRQRGFSLIELLIVVTPRIVHPSDSALPTPAMPKAFLGATVPAPAPAPSSK